jgi:hypothetical protein
MDKVKEIKKALGIPDYLFFELNSIMHRINTNTLVIEYLRTMYNKEDDWTKIDIEIVGSRHLYELYRK